MMNAIEIMSKQGLGVLPLPEIILARSIFSIKDKRRVFYGEPGVGKTTALRYVLDREVKPDEKIFLITRFFDSEELSENIKKVVGQNVILVWDDADPQLLIEATSRIASFVASLKVIASCNEKVSGFRNIRLKGLDEQELRVLLPSTIEKYNIRIEQQVFEELVKKLKESATPFFIISLLNYYKGKELKKENLDRIPMNGEDFWRGEYILLKPQQQNALMALSFILENSLPPTLETLREVYDVLWGREFEEGTLDELIGNGWVDKAVDEYHIHSLQRKIIPVQKADYASMQLSHELKFLLLANSARRLIFDMPEEAINFLEEALKIKQNSYALNLMGVAYMNVGNLDSAVDFFNQSISKVPSSGAYFNKGIIHLSREEYDKALLSFNHALELSPNNPLFLINKALAHFSKKEFAKAIAECEKAIALFDHPAAYLIIGNCHYELGDIDNAIAFYKKLIEKEENSLNYNLLGNAYLKKNDYEEAIKSFDNSILIEPNADALANRGLAYFRLGDLEKARSNFIRALESDPNNEKAKVNYALLLFAEDNFPETLRLLEEVNRRGEKDYVYFNLALVYLATGDRMKALEKIDRALSISKKKEYFNLRAVVNFQMEKYNEAQGDYETIIGMDAREVTAYYGKGMCCIELEQYDRAIGEFSKAIDVSSSPQLFNLRGLAHLLYGEYDMAIKDIDFALQKMKSSSAYSNKALALLAIEEYESALENANKALELDKNNPKPYNIIGLAKIYMGQKEEGVNFLAESAYKYLFNGIMGHAIEALEEIRREELPSQMLRLKTEATILLAASKEITGRKIEPELLEELKQNENLLDFPHKVLRNLVEGRTNMVQFMGAGAVNEKDRALEKRISNSFNNKHYDDLDGIVYKITDLKYMVVWWLVLNILKENSG